MSVQTDIAVLSAGAVTVAIASVFTPGHYELTDFTVGFAMTAMIVAYVFGHERDDLQRIAVAAVSGFVAIPMFGMVVETLYQFIDEEFAHFIAWAVLTGCAWMADKFMQEHRSKVTST